ncbi:MAG: hypothetical protein V7668_00965 [Cereibacter changlensis]
MLHSLATLWVGPLGPIEYASIASILRFGHRLTIFSYAPLEIPEGVEWRDANEVYPAQQVASYAKTGSPSLHSNFFRYALMKKTEHVWVDLDMILLRPFDFEGDYILGHEGETRVNCAVLRMPKDSPALAELLRFQGGTRGIAPHVTGFRRFKYQVMTLGRGKPIEQWPWGSTGPRALSIFLRKHGEIHHALPVEAFYAIPPGECRRFLEPQGLSDESFGPGAYAVHLSASNVNKLLRREFGGVIPPGSFLGQHVARARAAGMPC